MRIGSIATVNLGAVGAYTTALIILYLAGAYLGSIFIALSLVAFLFPIFSCVAMGLTASFFKYHQSFSSDHPVKGEAVVYTLAVSKESPVPSVPVTLRLVGTRQGLSLGLQDISIYPGGGRRFSYEHVIRCPFRGVYVVGLESTEVHGYLGWCSFFIPAWTRTFYVYPRIIDVVRTPFEEHGTTSALPGLTSGSEEDHTLVESLAPYRAGEGIRHISWKKFAMLGSPVLKSYDASSQPGVVLILDTRGDRDKSERTLEMEDTSVEVLVALAKHFNDRGVPTAICGDGLETVHIESGDRDAFRRFHLSTIGIFFHSQVSPATVLRSMVSGNLLAYTTVIFVTHRADPELFELAENPSERLAAGTIMNVCGMGPDLQRRLLPSVFAAQERGARISIVNSSQTIREDLER